MGEVIEPGPHPIPVLLEPFHAEREAISEMLDNSGGVFLVCLATLFGCLLSKGGVDIFPAVVRASKENCMTEIVVKMPERSMREHVHCLHGPLLVVVHKQMCHTMLTVAKCGVDDSAYVGKLHKSCFIDCKT